MATRRHSPSRMIVAPRGFTLVELLVAVLVLLVVILAVGRIFSSSGRVTAYGEATSDLLQEAQAIERQMRRDFANLSADGFLAIQCIEVRNDVNFAVTGQLLDPSRPADWLFRADRLICFVDGAIATSAFSPATDIASGGTVGGTPHGAVSRVYYGHGVQFPTAPPSTDPCCFENGQPLAPWSASNPFNENTYVSMQSWPQGQFNVPPIVGNQPAPPGWILLRQPVLLGDDGGDPRYYTSAQNNPRNAAATIWPDIANGATDTGSIRKGRVDISSQTAEEIEHYITRVPGSGELDITVDDAPRGWFDQSSGDSGQEVIARAFAYPRGERTAPSTEREDQMLTNALLGSGVSSFAIDWTYADRSGGQEAADGSVLFGVNAVSGDVASMAGVLVDDARTVPWFGLPDRSGASNGGRGVQTFTTYAETFPTLPVYPISIENPGVAPGDVQTVGNGNNATVRTYQAAWGPHRNRPYVSFGPNVEGRIMSPDLGFSPLPTAIRVTMTLHDPKGTLERGRTFQFVIPIPSRNGS
ncbi:MAG: prepilin-type N-terminal cleavage/methylation domain-containing protein [Phycisphaerales bacterium]